MGHLPTLRRQTRTARQNSEMCGILNRLRPANRLTIALYEFGLFVPAADQAFFACSLARIKTCKLSVLVVVTIRVHGPDVVFAASGGHDVVDRRHGRKH